LLQARATGETESRLGGITLVTGGTGTEPTLGGRWNWRSGYRGRQEAVRDRRRLGWQSIRDWLQRGDKLIPIAPLGANHVLGASPIAHAVPDRAQTALQGRVTDGHAFPDLLTEFLFRNDPFAMQDEVLQDPKYLGREALFLACTQNTMLLRIKLTSSKTVNHRHFPGRPTIFLRVYTAHVSE
jgi:hypothetical protein